MKIFRRGQPAPTATDGLSRPVLPEAGPEIPPDVLAGEPYEDPDLTERKRKARLASLSMQNHGSIARPRIASHETDAAPVDEAIFEEAAREETERGETPVRRRIWDIEAEPQASPAAPTHAAPAQAATSQAPAQPPSAIELDDVALARARIAEFSQAGLAPAEAPSRGQRAKTRLLGFHTADLAQKDPFSAAEPSGPRAEQRFPVGWLVVVQGPGRGACFTLTNGVSSIGRGEDQAVCLDFGDGSISRSNHAAIAYDDEANSFFLGQGGKSNIVRLNGRPVLSTEDLSHGDRIRIGETGLQFVAFCGDGFSWAEAEDGAEGDDAARQ